MPKLPSKSNIPAIEWIVGALGAALIGAILVFLMREALSGPGRPPDIVADVDTIVTGRGGWLVQVHARNLGDRPAADIAFEGTLMRTGGDTIIRDGQLDYLPGHSRRALSFVFPVDPRDGRLTIRALSHQAP